MHLAILTDGITDLSLLIQHIPPVFTSHTILTWDHFFTSEEISSLRSGDIVMLNSQNPATTDFWYTTLSSLYSINASIILDFWGCLRLALPRERIKLLLSNPWIEHFDGIILGISHSEVGILSNLLPGNWVHLAVTSQDLYYNYLSLVYCAKQYPEKIRNLKYLIIDLYEYAYFNFDTSLSGTLLNYWRRGGIRFDTHNLEFNKNYKYHEPQAFFDVLENELRSHITEDHYQLWHQWFHDIINTLPLSVYDFQNRYYLRNHMVQPKEIEIFSLDSGITSKDHPDTIEENIRIFRELLLFAKSVNPQIQIHAVILPRISYVRDRFRSLQNPWKEGFYEIISSAQAETPFEFHDYTEHPFSNLHQLYEDVAHFNFLGASIFTNFLISDLGLNL